MKVSLSVKHNAPTVVVAITSTLNEKATNESWGIRDFTLDIKECPDSCKVCEWSTRKSPEVCDNWKLFATSLTSFDPAKLDILDWNV